MSDMPVRFSKNAGERIQYYISLSVERRYLESKQDFKI